MCQRATVRGRGFCHWSQKPLETRNKHTQARHTSSIYAGDTARAALEGMQRSTSREPCVLGLYARPRELRAQATHPEDRDKGGEGRGPHTRETRGGTDATDVDADRGRGRAAASYSTNTRRSAADARAQAAFSPGALARRQGRARGRASASNHSHFTGRARGRGGAVPR